jgi:heme-degrading monooxygenase HmoA
MVIVLIRTKLRPDADLHAYEQMDARMYELVSAMPGFVGAKGYKAEDGESISLIQFDSHEALLAWRHHPEHEVAQRAGRERFFASYDVRVCTVERTAVFPGK